MDKKELHILIGMSRTLNKLNRNTITICTKYNLSLCQFGVLEALFHKGDLTIGQVKSVILSSDGTIPVVVRNLEKYKLIRRYENPNDKRSSILTLTDKGRDLISEVYPKNEAMIIDEMKVWSSSEKEDLLKLLRKFGGRDEKKSN